jgi:Phosphotransferase enzyme family
MSDPGAVLPRALAEAIEAQTGRAIAAVVSRGGSGGSRNGAEVTLAGDPPLRGYLGWDPRLSDPSRGPAFRREVAILAALSGPLRASGVRAPPLIAHNAPFLAVMTGFIEGTDRWEKLPDGPGKQAAGIDYVRQIARLHAIDACAHPLDGFGDPAMPTDVRLRHEIADLRDTAVARAPDPILLLALDWLADNIPSPDGPPVIVHGDAGPGNLLCEPGRANALIDWEMSHYGDPMEDLAAVWVRTLFNPFIPIGDVFAAYEEASGRLVPLERVLFHRLCFELSFMVDVIATANDPGAPPSLLGNHLMFQTAHLRIIVRQTADRLGIALPDVALPDAPASERDRSFALALDDLRDVIVPRAGDQQASVKAKSLARTIKFWRQRDRYGAAFDIAEVAEVSAALGQPFADVASARRALGDAVIAKAIAPATALGLSHARMTRESALMGEAMGSLRDTWFTPLD